MPPKRFAEIMLSTAALGYSAIVQVAAKRPEMLHDEYTGAVEHLQHTALSYAGGNLDAAERAELLALRRFRDGVVGLRGDIVAARRLSGDAHDGALADAAEAIDALLMLHGTEPAR